MATILLASTTLLMATIVLASAALLMATVLLASATLLMATVFLTGAIFLTSVALLRTTHADPAVGVRVGGEGRDQPNHQQSGIQSSTLHQKNSLNARTSEGAHVLHRTAGPDLDLFMSAAQERSFGKAVR
jgi:hypothetical protein